jgi:hypothetical protein
VGNRAAVIQALREQSGMSTPIRVALWMPHALLDVLLEQIREQDRLVAFRTVTTQSDRPAEPTGLTAALADEALLAVRTFVDRVGYEPALPL